MHLNVRRSPAGNPTRDGRQVFRSLCSVFAALLVLAAAIAGAGPAGAGEAVKVSGYKMAGDAARTRIVMRFDKEPEIRWFLLRAPHRLVVDLPQSAFSLEPDELAPRGMVTEVRYGNLDEGRSRMIVAFDGPFDVERIEVLENEDDSGHRLVADIVAGSEKSFEQAMAEQIEATGSMQTAPKSDRVGKAGEPAPRKFRIMIDPGHGGIDTGAQGSAGTQEKTITLAFALELKKELEDHGRHDVFLTRDRDLFLGLDERVRIARQHEADLLISIHADSIRLKDFRGATVYTVADKASDAEAAAKAIRENLADEIGGIVVEDEQEGVADILADLIRRETQSFSLRFARSLVGELSTSIQMIPTNPHRYAGFRVLRAPDVPSVLLELGYLSNASDEEQLRDPEWRARAAESIISAIDLFVAGTQRAGG